MHVASRAVTSGDRVFVIGAGPIGVLMAKAALLYGASRVLITDPVADRLRLAEAQGAEAVTGDDPAQAVIDATDGDGADVVIDAAGYEATWAMGLRAVRSGGRIDEVGLGSGSGHRGLLRRARQGGDDHRLVRVGRRRLRPSGRAPDAGRARRRRWLTTMALADGQRAFEELVGGAGHFKVVLVP